MEAVFTGIAFLAFVGFLWLLFMCRYDLIAIGMGEPLKEVYRQAEDALEQWQRVNGVQARQHAVCALASAVNEANRLRGDAERPHVFTVTGEDLVRDHLSQYEGSDAMFRAYDAHQLATS